MVYLPKFHPADLSRRVLVFPTQEFSNWPTIPQLYLDGEFIGGADIVIELFQTGELQEMIEVAAAS